MSMIPETQKPLPPLPYDKQSIRLLRYLSPEKPQLPLKFELRAFDLANCPKYAALSYTWLNPFLYSHPRYRIDKNWDSRSGIIYCNDEPVSILPNLHEALQELVLCHGLFWLFIDALCINQNDEIEKANQVGLLTKVFANAEHCICWLGPADETMETCITAVRTFYQILSQAAREGSSQEAWMDMPIQHHRVMQYFPLGSHGRTMLKKAVHAIALLGKRRWFTRAWVVQEFALSRDVFMFCGRHTIDSQHLRMVSLWLHRAGARWSDLRSIGMTLDERHDTKQSIARIVELTQAQDLANKPFFVNQLRLRYGVAEPMQVQVAGLLDFLYRCRHCETLDERDRIYALSGIMSMTSRDLTPFILEPDYSLSHFEVFTQTTCQFVQYLPTLEFLALAGRSTSDLTPMNRLPSWVPDWAFLPDCVTFQSRPSYKAGLSGSNVGPRTVNCNVLTLQGVYVDVVRQTGSNFIDLVNIALEYLNSPNKTEAAVLLHNFWRTMLWGNEGDTNEGQRNLAGIPSGQHDVAIDLLWLSRHHYRQGHSNEETVKQMAGLVKLVSGDTLQVSNIVQVMKMDEKDVEEGDKASARLGACIGERKRATMLSCFRGANAKAFCCTVGGKMGSGPPWMRNGDLIYVLRDARLPCLLRQLPDRPGQFHFLGEIFVEGFALGEALQKFPPRWRTVHLV